MARHRLDAQAGNRDGASARVDLLESENGSAIERREKTLRCRSLGLRSIFSIKDNPEGPRPQTLSP